MNIFRIPYKLLESVNDAESHDVKNHDSLSGSINFDSEPTQFQPTWNHIFWSVFCVKQFPPFDKIDMNTFRILRMLKLYFLRILKLSLNKIFYETEKLLFSFERAQIGLIRWFWRYFWFQNRRKISLSNNNLNLF